MRIQRLWDLFNGIREEKNWGTQKKEYNVVAFLEIFFFKVRLQLNQKYIFVLGTKK
jgi:hypothetical protein